MSLIFVIIDVKEAISRGRGVVEIGKSAQELFREVEFSSYGDKSVGFSVPQEAPNEQIRTWIGTF